MRNSEPLTPEERKRLRASLSWTVGYVLVFAGYVLICVLADVLNFAALFGVDEYDVWLFLSELVGVLIFFAVQVGWWVSLGHALPVVRKRPICLVWLGAPVFLFVGVPLAIVLHFLGR
jgi:hypothetical protein